VAGGMKRLAQRRAVVLVLRSVDILFGEHAGERLRAEERAEMPLLVGKHNHVDAGIAARFLKRARGFERVDAAERAVEPAGMVLRFQMRAGENLGAARPALSQNVADTVDRRFESRFGAALGKPCARGDILRREGRAMDAGLVAAEGTQLGKIAEQTVGLDGGHGRLSSFRGAASAASPESITTELSAYAMPCKSIAFRGYGFRAPAGACHRAALRADPLGRPRNDR